MTAAAPARQEPTYVLVGTSGKPVGAYATEMEAEAARVRAGGGTVRKL